MTHLNQNKFKSMFCKTLRFLNLVDRNCNLSITNIAVIVLITKMAIAPFDWATAAGLLVTLINYAHKRTENSKAEQAALEAARAEVEAKDKSEVQVQFDALREAVEKVVSVQNAITQDMVNVKATHELVAKQAEETKKFISNSNLANAFTPRRKLGE